MQSFRHPLINQPYELSHAFISTNPEFFVEWKGMDNQLEWGRQCLNNVKFVYALAKSKNHVTIHDLYSQLAQGRFNAARVLNQDFDYGLSRDNETYVSTFKPTRLRCKNQYSEIEEKVKEIIGIDKTSDTEKTLEKEVDLIIMGEKVKVTYEYDPEDNKIHFHYPQRSQVNLFFDAANHIWEKLWEEKDSLS